MKRSVFVLAAGAAIVAGSILAATGRRVVRAHRRSRWASSSPASGWTAETSAGFRAPTRIARSSPRHRAVKAPATESGAHT